ncbi:hypothetical protein AWENTII_002097 [Aspergillus wentii]
MKLSGLGSGLSVFRPAPQKARWDTQGPLGLNDGTGYIKGAFRRIIGISRRLDECGGTCPKLSRWAVLADTMLLDLDLDETR